MIKLRKINERYNKNIKNLKKQLNNSSANCLNRLSDMNAYINYNIKYCINTNYNYNFKFCLFGR
jgi:hypothetical protein